LSSNSRIFAVAILVAAAAFAAMTYLGRAPQLPADQLRSADRAMERGDVAAAEGLYREAIRQDWNNGQAHARLGFLLYESGRDEEALAHLIHAKTQRADAPMIDFTIAELQRRHAPDAGAPRPVREIIVAPIEEAPAQRPPEPERDASTPFERPCELEAQSTGGRGIVIELSFAGQPVPLVFDTGASMTVLSEDAAERLRLEPGDRRMNAMTANGRAEFATARAIDVELAGRRVAKLLVAVCTDCMVGHAQGLLGMDLISELGLELDPKTHRIRFSDCRR
jgi:clan AA aspartic protease (TIGR02281 family)